MYGAQQAGLDLNSNPNQYFFSTAFRRGLAPTDVAKGKCEGCLDETADRVRAPKSFRRSFVGAKGLGAG